MADPTEADAVTNGHQEARDDLLRELVAHLRNNRTDLRQEWARRIGEARLLTALTEEEIFSEATSVYDNYVEVLETGLGRGAAGLRPQPLRAHHPARRRDRRGARHRAAAARRARALAVREVPGGLPGPQRGPRRLRAGREPHRQHGGRELRAGARAHHPPAAGGDPRALDAGAPGPRAAADPPDHRRARRPARPPADRAAAARHPHQPRPRGRDRHHGRARRSTRRSPTTSSRPSTPRG